MTANLLCVFFTASFSGDTEFETCPVFPASRPLCFLSLCLEMPPALHPTLTTTMLSVTAILPFRLDAHGTSALCTFLCSVPSILCKLNTALQSCLPSLPCQQSSLLCIVYTEGLLKIQTILLPFLKITLMEECIMHF